MPQQTLPKSRQGARHRRAAASLFAILLLVALLPGCAPPLGGDAPGSTAATDEAAAGSPAAEEEGYAAARRAMVERDLKGRDIRDPLVLDAMGRVQRQLFVDGDRRPQAYSDHPLPIGDGQTISQPYIVALMTQSARVGPEDKVLEIGTGSGYQAAVLREITGRVYSIEIRESLAGSARRNLDAAGYPDVSVTCADGYFGWEENAPFDAILITCAADHIPPPLLRQLSEGGRLILPLGDPTYYQTLTLAERRGEDFPVTYLSDVRFVPMTGRAQE